MDILEYAKSHFFIKLIDMGNIWEVHMQSMLNKEGRFVDIQGRPLYFGTYTVYIRKDEGFSK